MFHVENNIYLMYFFVGSGNILSDNFHPGWFLLEKHADTEWVE